MVDLMENTKTQTRRTIEVDSWEELLNGMIKEICEAQMAQDMSDHEESGTGGH